MSAATLYLSYGGCSTIGTYGLGSGYAGYPYGGYGTLSSYGLVGGYVGYGGLSSYGLGSGYVVYPHYEYKVQPYYGYGVYPYSAGYGNGYYNGAYQYCGVTTYPRVTYSTRCCSYGSLGSGYLCRYVGDYSYGGYDGGYVYDEYPYGVRNGEIVYDGDIYDEYPYPHRKHHRHYPNLW
ncbi:unnamed protein product [Rotaria sordida]|uniref:Uncharacterized protein n=1 Tax=Rotaria sordida TaxID=392033 RepID=A0A819LS35_9BILA|nr:unnamed protein product [Rotaria sordida]